MYNNLNLKLLCGEISVRDKIEIFAKRAEGGSTSFTSVIKSYELM